MRQRLPAALLEFQPADARYLARTLVSKTIHPLPAEVASGLASLLGEVGNQVANTHAHQPIRNDPARDPGRPASRGPRP